MHHEAHTFRTTGSDDVSKSAVISSVVIGSGAGAGTLADGSVEQAAAAMLNPSIKARKRARIGTRLPTATINERADRVLP
jgi:hypothetical protein